MTRGNKKSTPSIAVKLSIWSVWHQRWLAGQIRIYIFAATALIALLTLADVISLQTAIFSSFCGGVIILALLWTLIQQRKAILLNIQEPEIRKLAHKAMMAYLRHIDHNLLGYTGDRTVQKKRSHHSRGTNSMT